MYKILNNYLRLTVSALGSVMGTMGRVSPLFLLPISSKSDGYQSTLTGFFSLADFSQNDKSAVNTTFAIPIYYIPFTDVQPVPNQPKS
jgi:hypothetical protein